jgi:phosphatidylserine synthase
MTTDEHSFKSLIPALFLGIVISVTQMTVTHMPTRATLIIALIIALIVQIVAVSIWWAYKGKKLGVLIRVPFILSIVTILGIDILFMVLQGQVSRGMVIIGTGLFTSLSYWLWFGRYSFAPEYQRRYTHQWYVTITSLTFFVWSASTFAFFILLRVPVWITSSFLAFLGTALMTTMLFAPERIHGLGTKQKHIRSDLFWVGTIMIAIFFQIAWTLHFLPFGFFINAYLLVALYLALSILSSSIINKRNFLKQEKIILTSLALLTIVVLISARWV